MNSRKALLIGIDKYDKCPLSCCINDIKDIKNALEDNYDGSKNFHTKIIEDMNATRVGIRRGIKDLFAGNGEIALLYFSGHGFDDENDGVIVSYDYMEDDWGIKMSEILEEANKSKFNYKIIILDCCHSGFMGNHGIIGDTSYLNDGTIIMTASKKDESSMEIGKHGVFTNLLLEALKGGASDILGNITPGSIYSYIDQALGLWSQRPLFKANISSFVSLKRCLPKIAIYDLKDTMKLFPAIDYVYKLDPSYEKTNIKDGPHLSCPPFMKEEHVEIFTKLQKCNRNGLVIPDSSDDMYFAAMESKGCKLTPLGQHYWNMIKEGII